MKIPRSISVLAVITYVSKGAAFILPASSPSPLHLKITHLSIHKKDHSQSTTPVAKSKVSSTGTTLFTQDTENNELQVLSFTDPKSNRKITLIGCMHYNPASISLVKQITSKLGTQQSLHSVLIESCPTRWKTSRNYFNDLITSNPSLYNLYYRVFNNEMITASNLALNDYNVPVVLGDQPIEITMDRVRYYFIKTLKDLSTPGGWSTIGYDLNQAFRTICYSFGLLPEQRDGVGKQHLTLGDFLDVRLVASMPFSLIRYPLSILIRNGLSIVSLMLTVILWQNFQTIYFPELSSSSSILTTTVTSLNTDTAMYDYDTMDAIRDVVGTIGILAAEITLFLRVFVLPILYERDRAIADMIVSVARNVSGDTTDSLTDDKVILAVLGMAHCNGVRNLIVNREI